MITPLLSAILVLAPQGSEKLPTPEKPGVKPKEAVLIKEWSDKEAKVALAEHKTATKGRKVPLATRLKAIEALATGRNKLLVKPLAKVVLTDTAITVAKLAAGSLGHQPVKQAAPVLLKLLADSKIKKTPAVLAAVIGAFGKAGYRERYWDKLKNLFEKDFSPEWVPVQKALLQLIITHKEKQAWKMLLNHIDEPAPVDVDAADNPPASYWEKRWKAWRLWRDDVKEALYALTGQRFSNGKEARAWIRVNGARQGLK